MELDYTKLSKAQQEAVEYAYKFGIAEVSAFTTSRKALERKGWLVKSEKLNTLPKYILTDAGRAAYEAAMKPAAPCETCNGIGYMPLDDHLYAAPCPKCSGTRIYDAARAVEGE